MKHHKWTYSAWGVTPGSGRPHGVDETWTCERCGASKGRGPQSRHTGRRVIRWWTRGPDGEEIERMGECTGGGR